MNNYEDTDREKTMDPALVMQSMLALHSIAADLPESRLVARILERLRPTGPDSERRKIPS